MVAHMRSSLLTHPSCLLRARPAAQSGVFSILSTVYVGEFNSAKLAVPLAKVVKHI